MKQKQRKGRNHGKVHKLEVEKENILMKSPTLTLPDTETDEVELITLDSTCH
jgi:hypothetical protein